MTTAFPKQRKLVLIGDSIVLAIIAVYGVFVLIDAIQPNWAVQGIFMLGYVFSTLMERSAWKVVETFREVTHDWRNKYYDLLLVTLEGDRK